MTWQSACTSFSPMYGVYQISNDGLRAIRRVAKEAEVFGFDGINLLENILGLFPQNPDAFQSIRGELVRIHLFPQRGGTANFSL